LLQQAKPQCFPITEPLSEKSSVSSMQSNLIIVLGHKVGIVVDFGLSATAEGPNSPKLVLCFRR
jgi:hypothetical protein